MNAWTGPDFIAFPFATINNQDFNNLLDVYLVKIESDYNRTWFSSLCLRSRTSGRKVGDLTFMRNQK
jgi:hypothetical protein